jgi:hypothetical protein
MSAKEVEELKTWRLATLIMVMVAVVTFVIQRLTSPVFDVVFEICIFYIPALTLVGILIYLGTKHG